MTSSAARSSAWGASEAERLEIAEAAHSLVGSSILRVSYMLAEGAELPRQGPFNYPGFDFISTIGMGIEFEMNDGTTTSICWRNMGELAGLSIGPGSASERGEMTSLVRYEVTDSRAWSQLVGHKIRDVQCVWTNADNRGSEAVWAARLDFEYAQSVVVALGGVDVYNRRQTARRTDDGVEVSVEIKFGVDDIVAIFDPSVAKQYWIDAASSSAFGT